MYETNLRKISTAAMYDETTTDCGQESILSTMDRFFKSVNTMNSVVMVPSKLVDIDEDASEDEAPGSSASSTCSEPSSNANLYAAYRMLVDAKEDLIWRRDSNFSAEEMEQARQFKHHLEALNGLLTNFAKLADHLTEKYQNAPGIRDDSL